MSITEKPLDRFIVAQHSDYEQALTEIKEGRKRSHWMWYIFPQIKGLGFSETSKFYALQNVEEAENYLNHPILGIRLIKISEALLELKENNATRVFGSPDDMKLKSSMTLFVSLAGTNSVFSKVLDKFFDGERDVQTLKIIDCF